MKFIKWLFSFIRRGLDDNIMMYAAQAAYYLVLSAIPFIILLLSVVQYIIPLNRADVLAAVPDLLSPTLKTFIEEIINEIFSKPMLSLISFSAVTTLWSASRGFAATERGIKSIYKIPKRKFFIADILISLLYTLIFIAMIILSLVAIVFERTIISILGNRLPWLSININLSQYILFYILMVLFFAVIYASFSSRKIQFRRHLPGAVFTASAWIFFSFVFSIYINYSRIYGSLTAIVLLMLWIYSCVTILLFGAEINTELIRHKGIDYSEMITK